MNITLVSVLIIIALAALLGHLALQYTLAYLLKSRNHAFYNPRMWIPGWFVMNYFRDPMYRFYSYRECWRMTRDFIRQVRNTPKGGGVENNPDAAFNGGA